MPRTERLHVRISLAEQEALEAEARRRGVTVASLVRARLGVAGVHRGEGALDTGIARGDLLDGATLDPIDGR